MKYVYPAVFTPEEGGGYSVRFPDFESCYTCGDDLTCAMDMAQDVLCLTLYGIEVEKGCLPEASGIKGIRTVEGEFVQFIRCDTDFYRRFYDGKAVKKTLSIPAWLNREAEQSGLNFSQVLQEALRRRLDV